MKRLVLLVLLVLAAAPSVQGCATETVRGSGNVVEEERPVSGFTGLHLAGIGTVTIELGDSEDLRIEAEDNLLEYIETEVRGGTLRIEQEDGVNLRPKEAVNFYVTMKELDSIVVSGSGEVRAPSVSARRFSVSVSGSGDVEIATLNADSLEVEISGSGQVEIAAGEVEGQEVTISGSGEYQARNMESATARVRVSGSGDATIRADERLEVNVSGSGDVRYVGSPTLDSDVSGTGDVERIGE